jgi:hypothetical protein
MVRCIHVIPVGGDEPVHCADAQCWCQPLVGVDDVVIHHAKDMREARERHGVNRPEEKWVNVRAPR